MKHKRRTRILSEHSAYIPRAAADLGVHRGHLWMVLNGRRESRRLMGQYMAWRRVQDLD
jgi:hypothetical protein